MGGIQGMSEKQKMKRASVCADFSSKEVSKVLKLLAKHGYMVGTAPIGDGLFEARCYEDGILKGEFTDLDDLKKFLEEK